MSAISGPRTDLHDGLDLDVAIVGGGVGGLYSGYRLTTGDYATGGRPQDVHIFESGDRVGGRLYSVTLPGMGEVTGELGGMRYMTSQAIATALIQDVFKDELRHVPFPMGTPGHPNLFYLRRQRFSADAWANGQASGQPFLTPRYALDDDDVGFGAYQLFNKVAYNVLSADPAIKQQYGSKLVKQGDWDYELNLTSQDWDAIKPVARYCFPGPFKGCLVNDLGFWNLLEDQCGQDGYNFLADAGGYYSNTINWNAGEAFENMVGDFTGVDVSYRTIEGGYDKVAYALRDAFSAQAGAQIWLENRLLRVDHTAPGSGGRRYQLTIHNQPTGANWRVFADVVVLALPRRSLELLDQECFLFSREEEARPTPLQESLPSVLLQPSMKILMGFTEPWWTADLGTRSGESVTDLPLRQCYYFGTDPENQHSLFLASYNDMDTVSFWSTLQRGELFVPRATRLVSEADLDPLRGLQAPRVMVAAAMAQVRELHGPQPQPIPDPYVTYFKDWAEDPFGGGYHAWAAGFSVKEIMEFMRRPFPGEAIHVTGEAYSDLQGWIEGAFCVSEHMLEDYFGLVRPSWIPADYYLGW